MGLSHPDMQCSFLALAALAAAISFAAPSTCSGPGGAGTPSAC